MKSAFTISVSGRNLRSACLRTLRLLVLTLWSFGQTANAGALVVGRGPECSKNTIQKAIDRAKELCDLGFCGVNQILVTDDTPDGVYHENLVMPDMAAYPNLSIELVGGYDNCRDLGQTTFGKASLYGGDANRASVKMTGVANVTLRNFWIEGGRNGIEWTGRGEVKLAGVTINNNGDYGARISSSGGSPYLSLLGGVEVVGHGAQGIFATGKSVVAVRGDGNSIRNNIQGGMRLENGAVADIGATGRVISGNGGYGLAIDATGLSTARTTLLYSIDPADPLRISGNQSGAIWMLSRDASYSLCGANIGIDGNTGSAFRVVGAHAHMEVNGESCALPQESQISCPMPTGPGMCNAIAGNTADNAPLLAAVDGATLLMRRMLLTNNQAATLMSANRGAIGNSRASVTLTDSLVSGNTLNDNLFEARVDGIVDIWDTTVRSNDGPFQFSFIGNAPGLMQMTNSILDQDQALVSLTASSGATTHFTHVLARNDNGAPQGGDILLGRPTYRDGGIGQLTPTSLGVDYAPAGGGMDFEGHPRDVDTIGVPNQQGPRDLGAFESQATEIERIFASGFERR
ncbi:MAG: right-handed parallel beta-helix repeat-containing protein [Dokdonella sp.]|uniref:right-handed parallel beta-helix repeat-containing protein n=1 Tax=Dokdonella sp. TaxID=2291710 RepID=UPI003F7CEB28